MTSERFMVDDAGTLIDMLNGDNYDYVSDVCPLVNSLSDENESLKEWKKEQIEEYLRLKNVCNNVKRENEQLKSEYSEQCIQLDFLKDENKHMRDLVNENKQLKQDIQRYSDWVDSVKRENVDKVFKMSIFEIAEAFEYYNKRIHELEKVLEE